ncbi:MAG: hypothetical protein ABR564_06620 [Candidatus Dormibacteria bacterium]
MRRPFDWERLGGAMGILFVVLLIASVFIMPFPPGEDEPTLKFLALYRDHRNAILVSAFIGTLATFPALWFMGSQRALLRRAEGGDGNLSLLAFGSAVAASVAATVGPVMAAGAAYKVAAQPDAGVVVQAINDVAAVVTGTTPVFIAVWAAAATLIVAQTAVLPRWLAWLGAAVTVTGLLGILSILNPRGGLFILGLINLAVFVIWVLAFSITMIMRAGRSGQLPLARA